MKKLVSFLGLVIGSGFALACSTSTQGEDPEYQTRIDEYAAHRCAMNAECGTSAPRSATYEECFADLSTQSFWWEGDDQCMDSRWEYYDCRAKVTSCDVWPVGAGPGHACDTAWADYFVDCRPEDEDDTRELAPRDQPLGIPGLCVVICNNGDSYSGVPFMVMVGLMDINGDTFEIYFPLGDAEAGYCAEQGGVRTVEQCAPDPTTIQWW